MSSSDYFQYLAMADNCVKCDNRVSSRQEALACHKCEKWQHRTCGTGVDRATYRAAVREDHVIEWTCEVCQQNGECEGKTKLETCKLVLS